MSTGTSTKERPALFTGPMVRAILNGTKTQTRRPVKEQPCPNAEITRLMHDRIEGIGTFANNAMASCACCDPQFYRSPFGIPGDHLWVRETWGLFDTIPSDGPSHAKVFYRATDGERHDLRYQLWRPSIHMPRWASRLTLEITAVRVERVQSIGIDDAKDEGVSEYGHEFRMEKWFGSDDIYRNSTTVENFGRLWDSIYADAFPWASNPWVWVYEFKRIEQSKN